MKKFTFLLAVLCTPLASFSQEVNVNVNVEQKKNRYEGIKYDYGPSGEIKTDFGSNANDVANDYAKRMQMAAKARAARAAAMSDPIFNVITPLTVDLYDYTHIAIVGATCSGKNKPKDCYSTISYICT